MHHLYGNRHRIAPPQQHQHQRHIPSSWSFRQIPFKTMSSRKSSFCDVVDERERSSSSVMDIRGGGGTSTSTSTSCDTEGTLRQKGAQQEQEAQVEESAKAKTKIIASSTVEVAVEVAGTGVSKRLTKQIMKCGKNYKAAFQKLFAFYPFLEFPIEEVKMKMNMNTAQEKIIESDKRYGDSGGGDDGNDQTLLSQLMDSSRPLGALIYILGKANKPLLGIQLLNQVLMLLQRHNDEINNNITIPKEDIDNMDSGDNDEKYGMSVELLQQQSQLATKKISFLNLIYKHIIGMVGQTIPKQHTTSSSLSSSSSTTTTILNGEYMLQMLYHDLPLQTYRQQSNHQQQIPSTIINIQPPPIDLYHNTLSALGKCKRMDLIMKLIHDMESNQIIQIDNATITSRTPVDASSAQVSTTASTTLSYQLPNPDRTSYTTALTAAIRCKAYNESIYILQQMKNNQIYPNVLAYNQVLSCICNSGGVIAAATATSCTSTNSNSDNKDNERVRLTKQILNEMEGNYENTNNHDEGADDQGKRNVNCDINICPTEATYKIVMSIYAKENQWDEIREIKQKMNDITSAASKSEKSVVTNVDSSISDANTHSRKTESGSYENKHDKQIAMDKTLNASEPIILGYMNDLTKLEKMNKKRPIWYKLGKYNNNLDAEDMSFLFGIQTHRNPSENGLSLVFHEEKTHTKIGYMLIRNTIGPKKGASKVLGEGKNNGGDNFILYSSFMGMYIDEGQRGKKLATKFMSIWLLMCIKSNAIPLTEIINKPLLSLVLTNFGFIPKDDESGIEVEVCPISNIQDRPTERNSETGWYPDFAMYSNRIRPFDGTFGERELRIQKMMITKFPPNPPGKKTFVKTSFDHPLLHLVESNDLNSEAYDRERSDLAKRVAEALGVEGVNDSKIELYAENHLLRRAVFGFLYD